MPVPDEGVDGEWGVVIADGDDFIGECDRSVRVAPVNHVEWGETSSRGTVVVEGEFCTCEVSVPVGLIGRDVVTDVSSNVAICILCLSVRLWVVCGA